jgi:hypothetical protein
MTETDSKRERGVLSPADRAYLSDPDEYTRQATHKRKKAITQRVRDSVLDLSLLLEELPGHRRREILGGQFGRVDPEEPLDTDGGPPTESFRDAVAFLYLAAADRPEDAQGVVEEGVRRGEQRLGPPDRRVEAELEVERKDLQQFANRGERKMNDGRELSDTEVRALLETGRETPEQVAEYVRDSSQ